MARLGFRDASAGVEIVERLGLDETLVGALGGAADPDLALRTLDRLVEEAGREPLAALAEDYGLRHRLVAVLGASAALGDHLVAHPQDWRLLGEDGAIPSLGSPST